MSSEYGSPCDCRKLHPAMLTMEPAQDRHAENRADRLNRARQWRIFAQGHVGARLVVVALGRQCHPMMPFMAQGAAMALEDAAILARCVEAESRIADALDRYETARLHRASTMQLVSRENEFLRTGIDADWV